MFLYTDINKMLKRKNNRKKKNMIVENNKIEYLKNVRELLIIIDMVNGFVKEGPLAAPSIMRVVPRQLALLSEALVNSNSAIAFVCDSHTPHAKEFKTYPPHCIIGSDESKVISEFSTYESLALTYLKNSTNLIFAPNIKEDLLKLTKLERIKLMGCLSEVCVLNGAIGLKTFFDELDRDVEVCVHSDAIDTFDAPNHQADLVNEEAIKYMQNNGIKILSKRR